MKVITATNGKVLRDYANDFLLKKATTERVAVFPEAGLDANEQAAFVLENNNKYDVVFTLSPFIISDAKNLTVLGELDSKPKFGDSVNKVTMNLWRRETVGDIAKQKVEDFRTMQPSDDLISDIYNELGDSVERVLLINVVMDGIDGKEKKVKNKM